jgi:hypothetical protein
MDNKRRKRKHKAGQSGRVHDELCPPSSTVRRGPQVNWGLNLFTLEEGIKHKASIGKHVLRERAHLLYAARIRLVSLAHIGVGKIVV